jgi:hypothetical protein
MTVDGRMFCFICAAIIWQLLEVLLLRSTETFQVERNVGERREGDKL